MALKPRPNHREYIKALQAMTPEQRLKIAFDLSEMEEQAALRQLARAFPELSELEIKRLYLDRLIEQERANTPTSLR
jgi:hypothetical protein